MRTWANTDPGLCPERRGSLSRAGEKLLCTGLLGTDVERREEGRADPVK